MNNKITLEEIKLEKMIIKARKDLEEKKKAPKFRIICKKHSDIKR